MKIATRKPLAGATWLPPKRRVRIGRVLATLPAICCFSTAAFAADIGPYVGLGVGGTSYPDATAWVANEVAARVSAAAGTANTASASQEKSGTGAKLFGGYALSANASVEVTYFDLGETKLTVATSPTPTSSTYTVEGTALSAALLLSQELGAGINLFGKMGLYRADTDITTRRVSGTAVVTERDSASNTGTHFRLGMTYLMTRTVNFRIEWENLFRVGDDVKTARGDVSIFSASMLHRF